MLCLGVEEILGDVDKEMSNRCREKASGWCAGVI